MKNKIVYIALILAVLSLGFSLQSSYKYFVGDSSGTKPTLLSRDVGSKLYETDTGMTYIWDGSEWTEDFSDITFALKETLFGRYYFCSSSDTLANGDTLYVAFVAPDSTKLASAVINLFSTGVTHFGFYEGASVSNGDTLSTFNGNRNSANTASSLVIDSPTVSSTGTLLAEQAWGTNTHFYSVAGQASQDQRLLMKLDSTYLIEVISGSDDNYLTFYLHWFEREL